MDTRARSGSSLRVPSLPTVRGGDSAASTLGAFGQPARQGLRVGVGQILRRHRDRPPDALPAGLDPGQQVGLGIGAAGVRTRAIERKLRSVETLEGAPDLLQLPADSEDDASAPED